MIITMDMCREAKYCTRGVRAFFARYNLDYSEFLAHGADSSVLLSASNNDAMVTDLMERLNGRK